MKVLIVGAGAVGSLLGWGLAAAGHEVTLLRRRPEPGAEADQLLVVRPDGSRTVAPAAIVADPASVATPELLVTAVKMYDLAAALASCQRWPERPLLAVENGVGAEELVVEARPGAGLIAGSLTAAVERAPSGEVHWLRRGGLGLARVRGEVGPLIGELAGAFAAQGLPTREYRDAASMKW